MLDRPGSNHATAIRETTRATLERCTQPITQYDLAMSVAHQLGLGHLSTDTMRRRLKEAVSELVGEGVLVVSDARGYRLARSDEDRAAGRRYLLAQVRSIADRLRSFDRAAADRLQLALDLEAR